MASAHENDSLNMLFAFGPKPDEYYISNGTKAAWNNIPSELERMFREDHRFGADKVKLVYLFPQDGFLVVAADNASAYERIPPSVLQAIEASSVGAGNLQSLEYDASDWNRFYLHPHNNPVISNDIPQALLQAVFSNSLWTGIRMIALGYNGTWVVISKGDKTTFNVENAWLRDQLSGGKKIRDVCLSPYNDQHAFVKYDDGTYAYAVPESWRPVLHDITNSSTSASEKKEGFMDHLFSPEGKTSFAKAFEQGMRRNEWNH